MLVKNVRLGTMLPNQRIQASSKNRTRKLIRNKSRDTIALAYFPTGLILVRRSCSLAEGPIGLKRYSYFEFPPQLPTGPHYTPRIPGH